MNLRKLCKIACVFLFLLFLQGNAQAVTIHGTVYEWSSFKPLNNAVVEINSTPEQYYVAKDAQYSFNLTPGTYRITANYFEGNERIYAVNETVVVSDKGEYVHDLLLFPTYEEELLNQDEFVDVSDLGFDDSKPPSQTSSQSIYLIGIFFVFSGLLLIGYFLGRKHRKSPQIIHNYREPDREIKALPAGTSIKSPIKETEFSEEPEPENAENFVETSVMQPEPVATTGLEAKEITEIKQTSSLSQANKAVQEIETNTLGSSELRPEKEPKHTFADNIRAHEISLPEDLKELLDVIRHCGNRITQRELRKKSPYSESKVSLMLSDLEERGLIEKFKRGRGNIIRIPDKHVSKQAGSENKNE